MTIMDTPAQNVPVQRAQQDRRMVLARDSGTLKGLLERAKQSMAAALPRHLTPDRMIRVALVAVSRSEELQKCTADSILKCVMVSAQLGLDPSGVLGSAYMVPFWNKHIGMKEAILIPGYRGLIDLARRSGQIQSIEARVVYHGDQFEFEYGLEPKLRHIPSLDVDTTDDKQIRLFYAVAHLKDGGTQVEVMTRAAVDAIRARSQSKDRGPWVTDYAEMGRKTVVKRIAKYLPLSVEFATATELDNREIRGEAMPEIVEGMIIDRETGEQLEAPVSRTKSLTDELKNRKASPPPRNQDESEEDYLRRLEAERKPAADDSQLDTSAESTASQQSQDEAAAIVLDELIEQGPEAIKKSCHDLYKRVSGNVSLKDWSGAMFKFEASKGGADKVTELQWRLLYSAVSEKRFDVKKGVIVAEQ